MIEENEEHSEQPVIMKPILEEFCFVFPEEIPHGLHP